MSDSNDWAAPSGAPRGPYGAPVPGEPAAPQGAGSYPSAPPPSGPGWTPPPKPGLIPLQPLTLGAILAGSFQVLRRNPKPTFGVALLLMGGATLLLFLVVGVVTAVAVGRIQSAVADDTETVTAGSITAIALSSLVPVLLIMVASGVMQGIVVLEVARGSVGERLRFRGLWHGVRGRVWALFGWSVLITLAITLALLVLGVIVTVLIVGLGDVGVALGVALGLIGLIGLVVLGAWLGTKLSLVPSALVLERAPLRAAMARSWSLTHGYFWRTLGIQLLVAVILGVVQQVVTLPVQLVFTIVVPLSSADANTEALTTITTVFVLLMFITSVAVSAFTLVVQSAVTALIYLDLRIRKEGLDLELIRFVDARAAGHTVDDPFLRTPSASTA